MRKEKTCGAVAFEGGFNRNGVRPSMLSEISVFGNFLLKI